MIKILFVCHGNICRSTMAEYVMRHLLEKSDIADQVVVDSAATSAEELGNPVHPGTRRVLNAHHIACGSHHARRIRPDECGEWDLVVAMDDSNVCNLARRCGQNDNVCKLLAFAQLGDVLDTEGGLPTNVSCRDVADPWYTGDFEETFNDVMAGCKGILRFLEQEQASLR